MQTNRKHEKRGEKLKKTQSKMTGKEVLKKRSKTKFQLRNIKKMLEMGYLVTKGFSK